MGRVKRSVKAISFPVQNQIHELYEKHKARVYGICLRFTGNPATAEDLAQDVWVSVMQGLHAFRGECQFSTWLYRVAVNTIYMAQRHNNTRPEVLLDFPDLQRLGGCRHFRPEIKLTLLPLLHGMPRGYRLAFLLHDMFGYEHSEAAEIMGVAEGTSKSQLAKARTWLADRLS